ncbi:MAG TPA: histidine kinase, partial [Bryobacteraceae bacterium]|nr:histidine kinase [Bryobacteraceae bacterium]
PERVQYSYKLEGLDRDWVQAGPRRVIEYSQVPHGSYRFLVKAVLPNGQVGESQFAFEVLPQFFETRWFFWFCALLLAGAIYGAYRMRLDRVHAQFALVSAERARMAREIHDTLAQGFVGISAQLDALAVNWKRDPKEAWQHLDLARRMARHSLTEARRSVLDLRATELEEMDLPAALAAAARRCTLGNPVQLQMEVQEIPRNLAADLEQNLLRIVQEAVTNVVKHAKARTIQIELAAKERLLHLRIKDDGQGFEPSSAFSVLGGHFGILGMRERAERMGGEFALSSRPGTGTELQITVPFVEKSAS